MALTICRATYPQLAGDIDAQVLAHGLRIVNLGELSRDDVGTAYCASRALIFPSLAESFGLPLIEAARLGLPIVGAELDYTRDVATPAEVFDPHSAVSIARAVRRFLGMPEPTAVTCSAQTLLAEVRR